MIHSHRSRTAMAVAVLGAFAVLSAGCGLFSRSKDKPPEASQPTPPPAPAPATAPTPAPPPPPRRPAGARIADEESLKRLVQGKTTKAEVRDLFGIPQEIVIAPGLETFIYSRDQTSGWLSRTTERVEMLTVRFDTQGVLKDFEYRYSGK
ncbi:MAG: hypothetical protein HY766_11390 [candidate division NC10 bacterium]|nr:hypothetical protein [candidate division NC10 bacterium]MBI4842450.1 hypothetical protein [candidate division NC10 bacterium]